MPEASSRAWWIAHQLSGLLIGDLGLSHLLKDGALSPDEAVRTIAAMPPLVDLDETEIEDQWSRRATQQWQLMVSLLTPDGPTGASLIVDLRDDDEIIGLVGFNGPVPDPVHALPTPRPDGRIPKQLWVGSPRMRFDRLVRRMPETNDRWDVSCPSQALWMLTYADGDIYNGGINQFYSNSTGNFADRFPEWARHVGAHIKADIIAEANLLFDDIDLRDRSARNDRLDELESRGDPFDELTSRYYDCGDDPLVEMCAAYVDLHPDAFFT